MTTQPDTGTRAHSIAWTGDNLESVQAFVGPFEDHDRVGLPFGRNP
ncbi:hypothetical protein AB0D12_31840 [Streptomyces sp. NPDC048479]